MFQFRRRLYIILSALTPFLLFQFYILHLLTDGNDDTEQIAYQLGTTFDSVMRHAPKDLAKPVKEDRPLPFSWSACLLIKDNNIILPEWLAYHYRKLFKERNNLHHSTVVDNTTPQYSSPENLTWLSQFVKLVGKEKALDLTQRIHLHEVWELEKNFLKLKFKE